MGSYLMNIKQVARLLNDIGVETVATDTSLGPDVDYGVNYYLLKLNNQTGKWEFLFMQRERQNSGGENLIKSFEDEAEAIKYYYLFQLHSYFFKHYIQPFELNNKAINIGETNCKIEDLKAAFKRLKIDNTYYIFGREIKERSISLEQVNKNKSYVVFNGENYKQVFKTPIMDNWLAYYAMYKFVYYLYLLDLHSNRLLNNKEISKIFTDNDYDVVLS